MALIPAASILAGLMLVLGSLLLWAHRRLGDEEQGLIDAIDALLPQTQCGQCGYPGCRPYAQAVAGGEAIDRCPPGGRETFDALKALLAAEEGAAPPAPEPARARIREAECVGCFLCAAACPVDAILGAPGFMHSVIEQQCTGCALCLPACPVDCIDLIPLPEPAPMGHRRRSGAARSFALSGADNATLPEVAADAAARSEAHRCIGCNRCEPVCPQDLAPRELLWLTQAGNWDAAASQGLDRCIQCRLCDRSCPSQIPLAELFGEGQRTLAAQANNRAQAAWAKARFQARTARLASERAKAQARRAERMANRAGARW